MNQTPSQMPALSVVFMIDEYNTIRRMISCLRAQTIRERIEIVIVSAPPMSALGVDQAELAPFAAVRLVETGPHASLRRPKAAGVAAASAPVVVLAESHCFPRPGWAEAIVRAHRDPWAAVGPAVGNANPDSMISWSNLLIDYGPWLAPHPGGPIDDLPGNNTSYKRDLLLAFGDALGPLLDSETILHAALRERGHRLYLEPTAMMVHLNVSRRAVWLRERYYAARVFADARAQNWSWVRRLLYIAAAPTIPLVRVKRILADVRRSNLTHMLVPRVLPALITGLIASAIGEALGYLIGPGEGVEVLAEYELHRERYVTRRPAAEAS